MASPTGISTVGAFKGLKTPREILQYNLMRGVTDFSNLEQYDLYEKGYPFLVVVHIPDFLSDLASMNSSIASLVNNYVHILENDFRGIDNIDNITGEANGEITNGIRSIQLINKVTKPSNSQFSLRFFERSGSIMTKVNELYLTGIKDPDTQVKHYHGLIDDYVFNGGTGGPNGSGADPGPHRECWAFMYMVTDNTMTKIERAFLICAAQPNVADFQTLYAVEKGQIEFPEISMQFNGFFINNDEVYIKAQKMLLAMRNPNNRTGSRIIVDSNNFKYKQVGNIDVGDDNDDKIWWNEDGQVLSTANISSDTGSKDPSAKYTSNDDTTESYDSYIDAVAAVGNEEHFINSVSKDIG